MGLDHQPVKAGRRYDSSGRRERARLRHQRVLRTAEELLLRHGYAATTVAMVATAAEVSPETIYKTFGGKAGLLRTMQQNGLAGAGPRPAPDRSDELSSRTSDPDAILRGWASLALEVAPRVAPLELLVRSAAATDAEMATLHAEISGQRLERMAHNARVLLDTGGLRNGLTHAVVRDVLFTFSAPELYELLVLQRGWPLSGYGDFLYRGFRGELLDG